MRFVTTLAALAALALAPLPAHATTFTDSEFVTWSQGAWGGDPACNSFGCNISAILEMNFDSVFAPFGGLLQVGIPSPAGFSLIFDSPDSIITYLPAEGDSGVLTVSLLDPVTSASGTLGGEVVTGELNVIFSEDGLLAHPTGVPFGDLVLQNLDSLVGTPIFGGVFGPEIASLDGVPVHELLSEANLLLGGATSQLTPEEMFVILNDVDMSFNGGPVSTFAMEHLAFPPSTTPGVPEPSTWALLLIGFASLGFVGYRASRRTGPTSP
jgi:hypothetical protein